jgi:hypothetical protein
MKPGDLVRSTWIIDSTTKSGMIGIIVATTTTSSLAVLGAPIVLWNGETAPSPARWEYLEKIDKNAGYHL